MARNKKQKIKIIDEYVDRIGKSKAIYIIEPKGLTASQSTELKKQFYDLDSSFNVIKNSLFRIALEKSGMELPEGLDENSHAAVFSSDQLSETAKVLKAFMQKNKDTMEIRSGVLDGKAIRGNQIQELADLPSREVLIAQVLGTMQAPITGFVRVLNGNTEKLMNVLNAIKDQKAA